MYRITHFNFKTDKDSYFLSNDLGNYIFLTQQEFHKLLNYSIEENTNVYSELLEKGFLYCNEEEYLQTSTQKYLDAKQCLLKSTQLFILVLTDACNQRCQYCQAGDSHAHITDINTCKKAINIAVQSPTSSVTLEFQGGKPTINQEALHFSVSYAKSVFHKAGKKVNFAIATNLTNVDEKLLKWLIAEGVSISTSLDGPKELHDINRPLAGKASSYDAWRYGLQKYRELCNEMGVSPSIGAIETTTRASLVYAREIVDAYRVNGINNLYIRPLTPLGLAKSKWKKIGYTADEYINFYNEVIDYILELWKAGEHIYETTASIYLRRILLNESVSHTEFRSPCGAGIGQLAINYDGMVYTCDEGRMLANMGDSMFRVGTVDQTYKELIQSPVVHAVCTESCLEGLPFCSECPYSPYCGVCPVVNYGMEGDLVSHSENSYRCSIARGILKHLFETIKKNDAEELEILRQLAL